MSESLKLNRIAVAAPEVVALKKSPLSETMMTGGLSGCWLESLPVVDGANSIIRFTLPPGPDAGGQSFSATILFCPSPVCRCGYIGFDCRPVTGDEIPSPDKPGYEKPMRLDLDAFNRLVKSPPDGSSAANALAQVVGVEMRDADWRWLMDYLQRGKREQMETMDLTTLDVMFPLEVVEDEVMVGYREVFPWAEVWAFELGEDLWLVWDEYCAQPDCECTDVALSFARLGDEAAAAEGILPESAVWLYIDYKTREWRVDNAEDGCPTNQLMATLQKTYPSLIQDLAERHRQLQQLGHRLIRKRRRKSKWFRGNDPGDERPQALVRPNAPVVGRNETCPCGSGKKYKKCCMAADEQGADQLANT